MITEWSIVGVLVTLVGLGTAIIAPIIKLVKSMTRLTVVLEQTEQSITKLTTDNTESHRRLWVKNGEQDKTISDHEVRIGILEHTK